MLALIVILAYTGLVIFLVLGMRKSRVKAPLRSSEDLLLSVVIPARNEADNIVQLLECLHDQSLDSSQFEVLLIDDQSEDNTADLAREFAHTHPQFQLQVLRQEGFKESPKKEAIELGISHCEGTVIVQTDADCLPHTEWLLNIRDLMAQHSFDMLLLPVHIDSDASFLAQYDYLESAALQCITFGMAGWNKPLLANGANLAYRKSAFEKVQGFSGARKSFSGDDISLLQKFKQAQLSIHAALSPQLSVHTAPPSTWRALFAQRVRWGGKNKLIRDPWYWIVTLFFTLVQVVWLGYFISQPATWVAFYFLKLLLDTWMLDKWFTYHGQRARWRWLTFIALIYPFLLIALVLASLVYTPQWKGRRIRV